jgi:hypothetical protein
MNRFQPIRLALPVIPVDDIDALAPGDLTLQVSKVLCPGRSKEHNLNINIAWYGVAVSEISASKHETSAKVSGARPENFRDSEISRSRDLI